MSSERWLAGIALPLVVLLVFRRSASGNVNRQLPPAAVTTMNWLRGLAAIAVLVGHVRGLFMQDYEALHRPSLAWKLFYLVSGLGHQAVVVFFVLSGFLVGSTVLARNANNTWNFRDYLVRRLVRLYVVLIPGLLLTAAWDSAGMHWFGTEGLYGGVLGARHLTMPDARTTLSLGHFAGNLTFLQHVFIAPFGTNGPLWSLSYEFWAYLLFPLLVRAGSPQAGTWRRGCYFALAAAIITAGGRNLAFYFGIWLLGAALAHGWQRARFTSPTPPTLTAGLVVLFGAALLLGRSSRVSDGYADVALALATSALLGALLNGRRASQATPANLVSATVSTWLANFSYTLYVAHYPVLAFLFTATMRGQRWQADARAVAAVLAISAVVLLLYALPLSLLTEAHTDRLRVNLTQRNRRKAAT